MVCDAGEIEISTEWMRTDLCWDPRRFIYYYHYYFPHDNSKGKLPSSDNQRNMQL